MDAGRVEEEAPARVTGPERQGGDHPLELLLRFARSGHEAGYPTADLEERVLVLARVVGHAEAQISATPTMVEVTLGDIPHQRSHAPAGLAFTLTLRARYQDALRMCGATVIALGANELGRIAFGREAAVFVAALIVGVLGGLIGSHLRRSSLVFIVPGVLMLVPGSAGFNSALQLLSNQTVTGITAAFDTFVTAMSIAYGLIISASLFPAHGGRGPRHHELGES